MVETVVKDIRQEIILNNGLSNIKVTPKKKIGPR